jgi:hypothetical protein
MIYGDVLTWTVQALVYTEIIVAHSISVRTALHYCALSIILTVEFELNRVVIQGAVTYGVATTAMFSMSTFSRKADAAWFPPGRVVIQGAVNYGVATTTMFSMSALSRKADTAWFPSGRVVIQGAITYGVATTAMFSMNALSREADVAWFPPGVVVRLAHSRVIVVQVQVVV